MLKPLKEDKEKAPPRKIVYFGDDNSYFDNIKQRFYHTYPPPDFNIEYTVIWENNPEYYYNVYLKLLKSESHIIYMDFSQNTEWVLDIAKLMNREARFDTPIVGLVDSFELARKVRARGIGLTHIKCAEYHDVVYHPFKMMWPKEVQIPEFALAKFTRTVELIDDLRFCYITPTTVHAEGNIRLERGATIHLEHNLPRKHVPSKKFVVMEIHETDIYYDYPFAYDLEMIFVDEPSFDEEEEEAAENEDNPDGEGDEQEDDGSDTEVESEGEDEGEEKKEKEKKPKLSAKMLEKIKQQRIAEYQNELHLAKKKHNDWVVDKAEDAGSPKPRILFIDPYMDFLKTQKESLGKYPYVIRCQTELSEEFEEIDSTKPDIIAYQFPENAFKVKSREELQQDTGEENPSGEGQPEEDDDEDEEDVGRKPLDEIAQLIEKIKSIEGYKPFLILFNTKKFTSQSFQDSYGYQLVLANNSSISIQAVLDMAKMYILKKEKRMKDAIQKKIMELKKKDPMKYRKLTPSNFTEPRFYVKSESEFAYAAYRYPIELSSMTESELTFNIDTELVIKTYRMDFPTSLSISLVPEEEAKKSPGAQQVYTYEALIHSIGEDEKKKVRLFVNEIFFTAVNEARAEELAQFKAIKEEKLKEKSAVKEDGSIVFNDVKEADASGGTGGGGGSSSDEDEIITFDIDDDD